MNSELAVSNLTTSICQEATTYTYSKMLRGAKDFFYGISRLKLLPQESWTWQKMFKRQVRGNVIMFQILTANRSVRNFPTQAHTPFSRQVTSSLPSQIRANFYESLLQHDMKQDAHVLMGIHSMKSASIPCHDRNSRHVCCYDNCSS